MAFLWNEKYYTGIDVIDKQYIAFLDLVNKSNCSTSPVEITQRAQRARSLVKL